MSTSPTATAGIHHVTAMCGNAQRNLDFYANILALRLLKVTVNFDDPGTYHFYYGDTVGSPGSILTFFPWGDARKGRIGSGEVIETLFLIPPGSLPQWQMRLATANIPTSTAVRFGVANLLFKDPDGMTVGLIEAAAPPTSSFAPWPGANANPINPAHAILGFHSVTLSVAGYEKTAQLLTETLGLTSVGHESERFRFSATASIENTLGATVDILCQPDRPRGSLGVGSVHHLAFRASDKPHQLALRETVKIHGLNVTPVLDRSYFESIYFREPGGILFEIATDAPGFATDEPLPALGTHLMLPHQYESIRDQLRAVLPHLNLPTGTTLP